MNKWITWFKGLISAMISSAAGVITVMIVKPETFNIDTGLHNVLTVAGVTAIVGAANYLKQSPLPKDEIQAIK